MTYLTDHERGILKAALHQFQSACSESTTTWKVLAKAISALNHPGPVTISAHNAPGSESASTESATLSEVAEASLLRLLTILEQSCDSFNLSLKGASGLSTFTFEAKPPTAATDSGPPKDGLAYRWSEAQERWLRV